MYRSLAHLIFLSLLAAGFGCGRNESTSDPDSAVPHAAIDGAKYTLHSEPRESKGVIDQRKESKDGDAIVVVGRVGGSKQPVVKDRAAFTIVDMSLKPCNGEADDCFDFA